MSKKNSHEGYIFISINLFCLNMTWITHQDLKYVEKLEHNLPIRQLVYPFEEITDIPIDKNQDSSKLSYIRMKVYAKLSILVDKWASIDNGTKSILS